jgi:hypothetical protein
MKICAGLLTLSLLFLATSSPSLAAAETLQCGQYKLRGMLLGNSRSGLPLRFYPGTRKQTEMLVRGMDPDQAILFRDQNVEIEAYVYVPGEPPIARAKYVTGIKTIIPPLALDQPYLLIKAGDCKIPK